VSVESRLPHVRQSLHDAPLPDTLRRFPTPGGDGRPGARRPLFARLRDAYLEPWGRPGELRETFELAQRLGPFGHVFKELRVLDAIPEKERHFVRDLPDILARCIAIAA
jgi:hypothetical protein